jgi:hypothetical protein
MRSHIGTRSPQRSRNEFGELSLTQYGSFLQEMPDLLIENKTHRQKVGVWRVGLPRLSTRWYTSSMSKKEVIDAVQRRRDFKALFHPFFLDPGGWLSCPSKKGLIWQSVPFDDSVVNHLPADAAGLYCFALEDKDSAIPFSNFILYVGKTSRNFRKRAKEYLFDAAKENPARPHIQDMLVTWEGHLSYHYAALDLTEQELDNLERLLIRTYRPPFNPQVRGLVKKGEAATWTAN